MIRSVCLAALVGLAGCGLIDSGGDELDVTLPEREVIVDTADWELTDEGTIPSVACEATPTVCANRLEMWCGADELCSAHCAGETCEIKVLVELWNTFHLGQERPELQEIAGQPLVSVTIDRVAFAINRNSLSVASPPLTVSVAPQGAISPDADGVEVIGTIPSIEAGQTVLDGALELTRNGEVVLADHMRNYETPFNLIVSSSMALHADEDVPSGRLVAVVKVEAHASTGL